MMEKDELNIFSYSLMSFVKTKIRLFFCFKTCKIDIFTKSGLIYLFLKKCSTNFYKLITNLSLF